MQAGDDHLYCVDCEPPRHIIMLVSHDKVLYGKSCWCQQMLEVTTFQGGECTVAKHNMNRSNNIRRGYEL